MKTHILAAIVIITICSCKKDDNNNPNTDDGYSGYVYTSNNATAGNAIIALGRKSDGSLTELPGSPYITGNIGDAAEGDFDSQGALSIVGDYLLAVNAGNNPVNGSISVFKIDRKNGSLAQIDQITNVIGMDNMDSRGVRPTSITAKTIGGNTWVLVGNQHSNPHYEMDVPVKVGDVVSSPLRNVAIFTFNTSTGTLEYKSTGPTYDGNNGGPTNITFNAAGTKVALSTWGVTHFMTMDADLSLQKPGRLYVYDFAGGNLTQTGMYEQTGVSGNIGISWSPNDQLIYMANFNLHSSVEDHSLTVHDGNTAAKLQNFATGPRNDEACWTLVTENKSKLYVVSFTSNVVSVFDIGSDNRLKQSLTPNYFKRAGNPPDADSKDEYQAGDFLYVSGAFQTHSIAIFKMESSGALTERTGSPYAVPSSLGKTKEQQSYIGLTGFEK